MRQMFGGFVPHSSVNWIQTFELQIPLNEEWTILFLDLQDLAYPHFESQLRINDIPHMDTYTGFIYNLHTVNKIVKGGSTISLYGKAFSAIAGTYAYFMMVDRKITGA